MQDRVKCGRRFATKKDGYDKLPDGSNLAR